MTGYTALADLYDEPIDPATVDFTTKPGKTCAGCIFQRQRIAVCNKVEEIAKKEALARCGIVEVVYVKRVVDGRQLIIEPAA